MRRTLVLTVLLVLALAAARGATAAPQHRGSSTLSGVVLGPDDKPVAHASVSYQSSGGNAPHAVHTDAQGRFSISGLRADSYDVRASGKGVSSDWEKNINEVLATRIAERRDVLPAENIQAATDQGKTLVRKILHRRNESELAVEPRLHGVIVRGSNVGEMPRLQRANMGVNDLGSGE